MSSPQFTPATRFRGAPHTPNGEGHDPSSLLLLCSLYLYLSYHYHLQFGRGDRRKVPGSLTISGADNLGCDTC